MRNRKSSMKKLRATLAALLGGVAGSLATLLAPRLGIQPMIAAGGVAVLGGALAALTTDEDLRAVGGGLAAAATARLVQLWLDGRPKSQTNEQPARNGNIFDRAIDLFRSALGGGLAQERKAA